MSSQLNIVETLTRILLASSATCLLAVASESPDASAPIDHAQSTLEELRAANVARAALSAEQAAWAAERERILAVKSANDSDIDSLTKEAAEVEGQHQEAAKQVAGFAKADDLVPVHAQLDATAKTISDRLAGYAQSTPPGAVTLPEHPSSLTFDEAMRCLDSSERSAGSAAIDVVSGQLDGKATAVKVLRVSGAAAWWIALDEHAAGILTMANGEPVLQPVADEGQRRAIIRAIAILEGRLPGQFEVLPLPAPLTLAASGPAAAAGGKP